MTDNILKKHVERTVKEMAAEVYPADKPYRDVENGWFAVDRGMDSVEGFNGVTPWTPPWTPQPWTPQDGSGGSCYHACRRARGRYGTVEGRALSRPRWQGTPSARASMGTPWAPDQLEFAFPDAA